VTRPTRYRYLGPPELRDRPPPPAAATVVDAAALGRWLADLDDLPGPAFLAVAVALDRVGVPHPGDFTHPVDSPDAPA
jgi:hypothetical protein